MKLRLPEGRRHRHTLLNAEVYPESCFPKQEEVHYLERNEAQEVIR